MARTAIQPVDMADPRPRYTHGWRVGKPVYVAGQLALDKDGNLVGPKDIRAQTRRAITCSRCMERGYEEGRGSKGALPGPHGPGGTPISPPATLLRRIST